MPPHIAAKVAVVYRLRTSVVLLFGLYRKILVFSNLLGKMFEYYGGLKNLEVTFLGNQFSFDRWEKINASTLFSLEK